MASPVFARQFRADEPEMVAYFRRDAKRFGRAHKPFVPLCHGRGDVFFEICAQRYAFVRILAGKSRRSERLFACIGIVCRIAPAAIAVMIPAIAIMGMAIAIMGMAIAIMGMAIAVMIPAIAVMIDAAAAVKISVFSHGYRLLRFFLRIGKTADDAPDFRKHAYDLTGQSFLRI